MAWPCRIQTARLSAAGRAGQTQFTTDTQFALARYDMSGTLDPSFDGDGLVLTNFTNGFDGADAGVAIQSDGKIVAAGSADASATTGTGFALARYTAAGGTGHDLQRRRQSQDRVHGAFELGVIFRVCPCDSSGRQNRRCGHGGRKPQVRRRALRGRLVLAARVALGLPPEQPSDDGAEEVAG